MTLVFCPNDCGYFPDFCPKDLGYSHQPGPGPASDLLALQLRGERAHLGDQHGGHPLHALRVNVQALRPCLVAGQATQPDPAFTRSYILPMTSRDHRPMRSNAATTRTSPCFSLESTDLQPLQVATPADPETSMSAWMLRPRRRPGSGRGAGYRGSCRGGPAPGPCWCGCSHRLPWTVTRSGVAE